jgi:hypothetical protein
MIELGTVHCRPGRAATGRQTLPHHTVVTMCGDKIHPASAGTLVVRELCHQKCLLTSVKRHVHAVGTDQSSQENANTFFPPLAHNYTWGRGGPGDRSRQIERHHIMGFLAPPR